MRLALWTVGLIFLQIAYSSDKYLKVTNYEDEFQDDVDSLAFNQYEEHVTTKKPRFPKLDNFIKQTFSRIDHHVDRSEVSATEKSPPIRHNKRHNKRLHPDYNKNEVKSSKERDPWSKDPVREKPADTNFLDMEMNDAAVPLSPVSQSKYDNFGTEEKVRERFQLTYGTLPSSIKNQDSLQKAANDHYEDMKRRTICKLPIPKLVRVEDVYPNTLKTYHPSCTIIHQCSEESGCCPLKNTKCTPSSTQNVTLYFIVATKSAGSRGPRQAYEGLSFINHTECKCMPEPDRRTRAVFFAQPSPMEIAPKPQDLSYSKKCPLPCPSPFSPRFMVDGTCICECNDDGICQKYKRGELIFKLQDNYCLFTNQCIYPSCAYGNYLTQRARCPKQYEYHRDSY